MSQLNSILTSLGGIASTVASAIVPGSDKLIEAGKKILDAFDSVKAINGGEAPADAEAGHDALFEKVMAHADSTLGKLEGDDG